MKIKIFFTLLSSGGLNLVSRHFRDNFADRSQRGVLLPVLVGIFFVVFLFGFMISEYTKGETNQLRLVLEREKLSYLSRAAADLALLDICHNYGRDVDSVLETPAIKTLARLCDANLTIGARGINSVPNAADAAYGRIEVVAKSKSRITEFTLSSSAEFRFSPTRILPVNRFTLYITRAASENFNVTNKSGTPVVLHNGTEPLRGGVFLGGGQVVLNLPDNPSHGLFHFPDLPDVAGFPLQKKSKGFIADAGPGKVIEFVYGHDTQLDNIRDFIDMSRLSSQDIANLNRSSVLSVFGSASEPSPTDLFFEESNKEPPGINRSFIRASYYYEKNSPNSNIYLPRSDTNAQAEILRDSGAPPKVPGEVSGNYKKFRSGVIVEPYYNSKINDYGKKTGNYTIRDEFKPNFGEMFKINADGTSRSVSYRVENMIELIGAGFLATGGEKFHIDLRGSTVFVEKGPLDLSVADTIIHGGGGILVVGDGNIVLKNVLKDDMIDQITFCALNGDISIEGSKVVASLCAPKGQVCFNGNRVTLLGNLAAEKFGPKDKTAGGDIYFDPNLLFGGFKFNVR